MIDNPHSLATAAKLIETAKDIVTDMASLTATELSELLLDAADVIYAQSSMNYSLLPEITITVNGDQFPVPPSLAERVVNKAAADWVFSVINDYVGA